MKRMTLLGLAGGVALALGLGACSSGGELRPSGEPAPTNKSASVVSIPSGEIGLVKGDLREVLDPPRVVVDTKDPGESELIPAPFADSPPVIPHNLEDIEPTTQASNSCLDCHETSGDKAPGEPTPLPRSHLIDLRNSPERVTDKVAGARWVCLSCHMAPTAAPDLVGNGFRP